MKTIRQIYFTDVKKICTNFFALVVAIAVLFLAALYAWANIYSNWDPYGSTSGMKIAVISMDRGYTDEDGEYHNEGQEVIDNLSTSIDWQFVDTEEEALEGVENGTYYAAVVITEDFSYNMYNVFTEEEVDKPQLIFYQNQKKNPVATKISDTVIGNIKTAINQRFVKTITKVLFSDVNDMYDDLEEDGGIDGFIDRLENVHEQIQEYESTLDTVIQGDQVLSTAISVGDDDLGVMNERTTTSTEKLTDAKDSAEKTQLTLKDYENEVNVELSSIQTKLADMEAVLNEGKISGDVTKMSAAASTASDQAQAVIDDLGVIEAALSTQYTETTVSGGQTVSGGSIVSGGETTTRNYTYKDEIKEIDSLKTQMTVVKTSLDGATTVADADATGEAVKTAEATISKTLDSSIKNIEKTKNTMNNELIPSIDNAMDSLENVLSNSTDLLTSLSKTLLGMGDVMDALSVTVSSADTSLIKTRDALDQIDQRLVEIIDKVNAAAEDDKVQVLVDTLSGDPDMYGEFFSEPVQMETTAVYAVENYGSAVAPFYSILAIWVGGTILVSILKVDVDKTQYPNATPVELFFGRYLLFFTMAQLQALLIVLGDIFLLGIQCMHPFLFWFAAFVAATTFSLFIYALTIAFADVGKAAAVVILVLQIAGSSGTYPIELLPEFFQKVYIFFPFPYVINAMREAIAGLYEMDYMVYLVEECIFIVVALVIGLVIRGPFEELKEYIEKRMHDTKMM